ncbi:MAG: TetR/AcrR family transcriptional regulator [Solirubrobacterales bacterium]|nr:TetR/AcrR family transcriptional regulator [Solirubrobacterales bacterium]
MARARGRPRDMRVDAAILAAAEEQLFDRGYAGISVESVAAAAGTTVPSLRRRYRGKEELVAAVVDSLRIEPLRAGQRAPRDEALAILQNFQRNLRRPRVMAVLGSILAEEHRHPVLLELFRRRLVAPRRAILHAAFERAMESGELPRSFDIDAACNMLIGAFYARYISGQPIPRDWPRRILAVAWPTPR